MSTTWTSPRAISASTCSTDRFSIRVFASSTICPTVFFGFHMWGSSVPYRRTGGQIRQRLRRREAPDILARARGQRVGRALEPTEPAVDVALENARSVGHQSGLAQRLEACLAAALDQHRAAERLLAVCGHDRRPRDAAAIGITETARVLAEQTGQAGRPPARPVGDWIHDHVDAVGRASRRDGHEAEPEPATEVAHVASKDRPAPAPAAARPADGQIDAI